MNHVFLQLQPLLPHLLHPGVGTAKLPDALLVFLPGKRLVEEVILLLAQVGTETTIAAPLQIRREETIAAVPAEGDVGAIVGFENAEAFVAEFGIVEVGAIDAVLAALKQFSVVTIFAVFRGIDEVAVLAVPRPRGEVAILVPDDHGAEARDCLVQFAELGEERTGEIERTPVLDEILLVVIPLLVRIHGVRRTPERFLVIDGDHLFSRERGGPAIEIPLIAVACADFQTTVRTVNGGRRMHFRLSERPADLPQESLFVRMDLEGLLAPGIAAGLLHRGPV